ncbi:MAG TPA: glycosyltransferase family 4 protein [Acidimicrobiales bacterium]|nr:glycosyltransferase family 4 protein [Acidimicrobiales bacterium]
MARTVAALRPHVARADVVVANHAKASALTALAAFGCRRPVVWWQHGWPEAGGPDRIARLIGRGPIVGATASIVDAQQRFAPRRRVEVIPCGIPTPEIARWSGTGTAVRFRQGWQGTPVIGIVGRLQPWKGQEVFLRAAARVARSHETVQFAVIGGAILGSEGDYPDRLRKLAVDLGIEGRVTFAGHQDPVYPWIDALDVVVNASFDEPFGLVVIESMALSKPVIATTEGGPAEIIDNGGSGVLFTAGDHVQLASQMHRLLDNPEFRARIALAGRARADDYSDEETAKSFSRLLDEITPSRTTHV